MQRQMTIDTLSVLQHLADGFSDLQADASGAQAVHAAVLAQLDGLGAALEAIRRRQAVLQRVADGLARQARAGERHVQRGAAEVPHAEGVA